VRATTRTYRDSAGGLRFAALVPENSFRAGRNEVTVGVIERRGDGEVGLLLPATSGPQPAELVLDGGRLTGLRIGNERLPIVPRAVTGFVERTRRHRGNVEISGWAAELGRSRLPREILVFSGERLVYSGMTAISEQRIVDRFEDSAIRLCGFRFEVPEDLLPLLEVQGVRLVAVSTAKEASELGYFHRYEHQPNGGNVITVTNGRRIPVRPGALEGFVEKRVESPTGVEVSGWATDPDHPGAPLWVLTFAGGRNVYWSTPDVARADVLRRFGRRGRPAPGFRFVVPRSALPPARQELRILALSSRGVATELPGVAAR
jgi:hypothetical protein